VPKHSGLHTALKLHRNEALHVDTIAKAPLSVITLNSDGLLVQQRRANKEGGMWDFQVSDNITMNRGELITLIHL